VGGGIGGGQCRGGSRGRRIYTPSQAIVIYKFIILYIYLNTKIRNYENTKIREIRKYENILAPVRLLTRPAPDAILRAVGENRLTYMMRATRVESVKWPEMQTTRIQ
jgi:hypothetical protein